MKRKLLYTLVISVFILIVGVTRIYANVQSRPGATIYKSRTIDTHFVYIRNMESSGNVLGLIATIDSNGNETSNSNSVDSHLMKKTELGAIVTLVNSQYGVKYDNITKRTTTADTVNDYTKANSTTKNMSGIMGVGSYSNVNGGNLNGHTNLAAAGGSQPTIAYTTILRTVKSRYINMYGTAKAGDASEYFVYDNIASNTTFMLYNNRIGYDGVWYPAGGGYVGYDNHSYAVIVNGVGV